MLISKARREYFPAHIPSIECSTVGLCAPRHSAVRFASWVPPQSIDNLKKKLRSQAGTTLEGTPGGGRNSGSVPLTSHVARLGWSKLCTNENAMKETSWNSGGLRWS